MNIRTLPVGLWLLFLCLSPLSAEKGDVTPIRELPNHWYEVAVTCPIVHLTPEQAHDQAVNQACREAVEFATGIDFKGQTVSMTSELNGQAGVDDCVSLLSTTARGIVLAKKIVSEQTVVEDNTPIVKLTVQVQVEKQSGERDPGFRIDADLNRRNFKPGDELELTVNSTVDCYILVFYICSNDSVYVLLPNTYDSDHFLKAGQTLLLPSHYAKQHGITYPLYLLPGHTTDTEMIKVIALKHNLSPLLPKSADNCGSIAMARDSLLRWLLDIPRDQVEECDLPYTIHEK